MLLSHTQRKIETNAGHCHIADHYLLPISDYTPSTSNLVMIMPLMNIAGSRETLEFNSTAIPAQVRLQLLGVPSTA